MEALIKIQNELKAPKNQYNTFGKYKYRSCEDILEAVKPLLLKYLCVLTISDKVIQTGNLIFVESSAKLSDGKNVVEVSAQAGINPNRKGMDIAQSFGSSSSYARKYALNGLFLIDDTKDPDAKDNTTTEEKATQQPTKPDNRPVLEITINGKNNPKFLEMWKAIHEGYTNKKTGKEQIFTIEEARKSYKFNKATEKALSDAFYFTADLNIK